MPRQTNKQNSFLLFGDGEWYTVRLVVVGRYTQTRQRWLRAKIIKSSHGRSYKRRPLLCARGRGKKKKEGKNHSNNHLRGITE